MKKTELAAGLRALLEAGDASDMEAAIRCLAREIGPDDVRIESADGEPDDCNGDGGTLWVTSERSLVVADEVIAEWTRCAAGSYGGECGQDAADCWSCWEDTAGGDELPEGVGYVLSELGLVDDVPGVPEPESASETHQPVADGEWCVCWETVGDDAGPVGRYATREAAQAVCDERNRGLSANHAASGGTGLLCCYSVRSLVDGEWVEIDG